MIIMDVDTIVENREDRDRLIGEVAVLDKVGKLLTLGNTELATIKQIAEYFGVPEDNIQRTYQRHKNEIDLDGVKHASSEEIIKFLIEPIQPKIKSKVQLRNMNGKKIIDGIVVPNRGMKLFQKRAILRIGMLLKKSKVAAELRTILVNKVEVLENTPQNNCKTIVENNFDLIETEKEIRYKWGKAIAEGDNLMANVYATQLNSLLMENRKILNNTISTQNFVISTFNYNRSLTKVLKGTGITTRMVNNYLVKNGYMVRRKRPDGINNNPYPTEKIPSNYYSLKTVKYGAVVKNGITIINQHTEDDLKWKPEGIKFILDILTKARFIKIEDNKIIKLKDVK